MPSGPLYWNLSTPLTNGVFPEGYILFLGLSGSGKTRRLLEAMVAQDDIVFATARIDGNGGSAALELVETLMRNIKLSLPKQEYYWTAAFFALFRFYDEAVSVESDGLKRVALWMTGSKAVEAWLRHLPEPPENPGEAIRFLQTGLTSPVLVFLDEIQAVTPELCGSLFSVVRRLSTSVVISGTGVSEALITSGWNLTTGGKERVLIPEPGP
eukprot:2029880-Rhodomonas_salina.1